MPTTDVWYEPGRVDAASDKEVPIEGRLPAGGAPFHKANGADPV